MYKNESNEELLNMLINANEVGASQEACEKLYNEVLRRMNASQQSVQLTGGTLPDFQALFDREVLSGLEADTTPPTSN